MYTPGVMGKTSLQHFNTETISRCKLLVSVWGTWHHLANFGTILSGTLPFGHNNNPMFLLLTKIDTPRCVLLLSDFPAFSAHQRYGVTSSW